MPESEREEQVLKIKTKHQQLIAQNEEHKVAQLSIGYQNYSSRLVAMMGYHREEQLQFMQDTQEKRGTLRADGKSEEEIVDTLTVDYSKLMEGTVYCLNRFALDGRPTSPELLSKGVPESWLK